MAETYIVILLWITTLGLFVVYNKFHKHLNKNGKEIYNTQWMVMMGKEFLYGE